MAGNPSSRGPESHQPKLYTTFIIFLILPIASVGLRLLSRRITHVRLWWDDWLILCAAALLVVNFAFLVQALRNGAGKHVESLTDPHQLTNFLLYTFADELIYATMITFVKSSILCMYLRLFSVNKTFAKTVYLFITLVVSWSIATFFSTLFQCDPIEAAWKPMTPGARCFNYRAWLIWTNVTNIVIDAGILALPVKQVWSLKLSLARRISLCGVFLVGIFTIICSIIRVTTNAKINLQDPTWNYTDPMIWSTIEPDVAVICSCLPLLAPLLRLFTGSMGSSSKASDPRLNGGGTYERSSKRSGTDGFAHFARLEDDTAGLFGIRKTVEVELEEGGEGLGSDGFDARRPGDGDGWGVGEGIRR